MTKNSGSALQAEDGLVVTFKPGPEGRAGATQGKGQGRHWQVGRPKVGEGEGFPRNSEASVAAGGLLGPGARDREFDVTGRVVSRTLRGQALIDDLTSDLPAALFSAYRFYKL